MFSIGSQGVLNDDEQMLRAGTGDIAQQSLGDHALAFIKINNVVCVNYHIELQHCILLSHWQSPYFLICLQQEFIRTDFND